MTINRTTLLDLPLPVTGTESGVWGDITNNGLSQYLDIAIAGRTALTSSDFTGGALTLSLTEGDASATNIAAASAQYGTIYVSSLAANSTITAPASNRAYRVVNADATYTLTIKAAGQAGITFPIGTSGIVVFNGTDYVLLGTYAPVFNVDNLKLDGNTISSTNSNGNITLAPNGTGRVEVAGTSSNAGGINLYEDTDNGTNKALLTAPAALGSDITVTLPDITSTLGFRNIPPVGTKTGSYTLAVTDVGEYVQVGSGGSITIPDATFAEGDAVSIFNNTSGDITITCSITTAYIAGTNTDKATVTLATRGVATVLFISGTVCVITGNVS
jgi:hypothetical protein